VYEGLQISIPTKPPRNLGIYLGRVVRNVAFSHWKQSPAEKRRTTQIPSALGELGQCIPDVSEGAQSLDRNLLLQTLNRFLSELDPQARRIFIARYWYLRTAAQISSEMFLGEDEIRSSLTQSRVLLKQILDVPLKPSNILSCLEKVSGRFIMEAAPGAASSPAPNVLQKKSGPKKPGKTVLIIGAAVAAVAVIASILILVLSGKLSGKDGKNPDLPGDISSGNAAISGNEQLDIIGDGNYFTAGGADFTIVSALYDDDSVQVLAKVVPGTNDLFLIPQNMTREDSTRNLTGLHDIPEGTVEQYAAYLGRTLAKVSLTYLYGGELLDGTEEYVFGDGGVIYFCFTAERPSGDSDIIGCIGSFCQDLEEASDKQTVEFGVRPEKAPQVQTATYSTFDSAVTEEAKVEIQTLIVEETGLGFSAVFTFSMEEGREIRFLLTDSEGNPLPPIPGLGGGSPTRNDDGTYCATVSCQKPVHANSLCFMICDSDMGLDYGPYRVE